MDHLIVAALIAFAWRTDHFHVTWRSFPPTHGSTNLVIAHPTLAMCSTCSFADRTNRKVSSTEAPLTFAVLTTERKAA